MTSSSAKAKSKAPVNKTSKKPKGELQASLFADNTPKTANKNNNRSKKSKLEARQEQDPGVVYSGDIDSIKWHEGLGKPPVILQVLPELKTGGVERGTIEIAKAGKKLGYEMIVASNGGHLTAQLNNAGITHITLPLASKNPFTIIANIRRLKRVIKQYNVSIVHARSRAPAWSAYFAAKKTKKHFITTFHGTYSFNNPLKRFYNSVMTKGEVVIAISDFIKHHIIEDYAIDPKKIKVVPRGVDLEHFSRDKVHKIRMINMAEQIRLELDMPVILLPGRFTRWKGQEFLIDALAMIKNENFTCVFAGYDKKHENYYQELEQKVREKDLFSHVRMIGEINDMPALYSLSDIVVSASTRPEAFGRVAIEGQAMERMVIATNHGGSCETIKHNDTGWLVKSGDVEGLAKTLKELLEISQRKRKMVTQKARKNIEDNFSIQNMVNKTFVVYRSIIGK